MQQINSRFLILNAKTKRERETHNFVSVSQRSVGNNPKGNPSYHQMSRVKWNEDNLAEIEANKPVRQKITEPKTPYHPMIDDEDEGDSSSPSRRGGFGDYFEDAMNILATSSSLNDVGSSSKTGSHHSGWTSSDDDTDAMDQGEEDSDSERRRSFKEHRKDHYDEFLKIKELRRNGSQLEDESDEESSITAGVKDIDIKESSRPANGS